MMEEALKTFSAWGKGEQRCWRWLHCCGGGNVLCAVGVGCLELTFFPLLDAEREPGRLWELSPVRQMESFFSFILSWHLYWISINLSVRVSLSDPSTKKGIRDEKFPRLKLTRWDETRFTVQLTPTTKTNNFLSLLSVHFPPLHPFLSSVTLFPFSLLSYFVAWKTKNHQK